MFLVAPQLKSFDIKIPKSDNLPELYLWKFSVRPSCKLKGTPLPCKVMGSGKDFSHYKTTSYRN